MMKSIKRAPVGARFCVVLMALMLASACGGDSEDGGGGSGGAAEGLPEYEGGGGGGGGDGSGAGDQDGPGSSDETPNSNDSCLDFTLLDAGAGAPSNITLLFSVQTCEGLPVANLKAEDFVITEDDATISAFESKQTVLPRGIGFDLFSVLLLDMSGSIVSSGSIPLVQQAASAFIDRVVVDQRVAIYVFDGRAEPQVLVPFTDDVKVLQDGLDTLSDYTAVDPSTNLNGAVAATLDMLDREARLSQDTINGGSLIVFTDGTDQAGRVSDDDAMAKVEGSTHSVFAVGLGEEVDPEHLASIGKDGAEFSDTGGILEAFNRVATRMEDESRKFYALGYCSPKRAGEHTLTLKVRDRRGELSYDFMADDFGPGCDPVNFLDTIFVD